MNKRKYNTHEELLAARRAKYHENRHKLRPIYRERYHKNKDIILKKSKDRWHNDPEYKSKKQLLNKIHRSTPEYKSRRSMLERTKLQLHKDRVYQILGGYKCNNCGYDKNKNALQLDHINGKGTKDRKGGYTYLYLKKYADDKDLCKNTLQILCANCNQIKKFNNKEF